MSRFLSLGNTCLLCCKNKPLRTETEKSWEWKMKCAASMCASLDIDSSFSHLFENGRYCIFCYQLFNDVEFVQTAILRLQRRLHSLVRKAEDTLLLNYHSLNANGANLEREYAHAVLSIGNQLLLREPSTSPPITVDKDPLALTDEANNENNNEFLGLSSVSETEKHEYEDGDAGDSLYVSGDSVFTLSDSAQDEIREILPVPAMAPYFTRSGRIPRQVAMLEETNEKSQIDASDREYVPTEKASETEFAFSRKNRKSRKPHIEGARAASRISKRIHRCLLCNYRTVCGEHKLAIHVQKKHEGVLNCYVCKVCGTKFSNRRKYYYHVTHTHGEPAQCPSCQSVYRSKQALMLHVKEKHTGELSKPKCSICSKRLNSEAELSDHEALHRSKAEANAAATFNCVICPSDFELQFQLQDHVLERHSHSFQFRCSECSGSFITQHRLSRHRKRMHQRRKRQLSCSHVGCNYVALTPTLLLMHLAKHTNYHPFACTWEKCSRRFKNKYALSRHLRQHRMDSDVTEARFWCSICSRGFYLRSRYREHMRFHGTDRPYLCEKCPSAYKTSANLLTHNQTKHKVIEEKDKSSQSCNVAVKSSEGAILPVTLSTLGPAKNASIDDTCCVCTTKEKIKKVGSIAACTACWGFFKSVMARRNSALATCIEDGECSITPETRQHCAPCRLKKCYAVGMKSKGTRCRASHTKKAAVRKKVRTQRESAKRESRCRDARWNERPRNKEIGICQVCECQKLVREAFGCPSVCTKCEVFFFGAIQKQRIFNCAHIGNCSLSIPRCCSACRFQKCLAVGMRENLVNRPCKQGKCSVCNKNCAQLRSPYGPDSCDTCISFFYRTIKFGRRRVCHPDCNEEAWTSCPGCRLRKCFQVGFKPELLKPKQKPYNVVGLITTGSCSVCGDIGSTRTNNGIACKSCALFFNKITRSNSQPSCKKDGNCVLDVVTRGDCRGCRLKQCLFIGMMRKTPYKPRKQRLTSEGLGPCHVCGEAASGRYYGVISCSSCLYFFMKVDRRPIPSCETENCVINGSTRGKCGACRLAKCIAAGMKKTEIRKRSGRIGRKAHQTL